MSEVARTAERSWSARLRLYLGKYFVNALLAALRPTVGQGLLVAVGALSAGAGHFVSSTQLRSALSALAIIMLVAFASDCRLRLRRSRQLGADEAARWFSTSLARLVPDGDGDLELALAHAALPLVASSQSRLGRRIRAELGLAEVDADEIRVLAGSGDDVARLLRDPAAISGPEDSLEHLVGTAARARWGAGHVRSTIVLSGRPQVVLFLVSSHPIPKEHSRVLIEMANTLRPALGMIRRPADREVMDGLR